MTPIARRIAELLKRDACCDECLKLLFVQTFRDVADELGVEMEVIEGDDAEECDEPVSWEWMH